MDFVSIPVEQKDNVTSSAPQSCAGKHNDASTGIAGMVETTRSRVNFFMNKFRKLGFIEYNGGLKVHDALVSVVQHDPASDR
jgi:hypothetical protein